MNASSGTAGSSPLCRPGNGCWISTIRQAHSSYRPNENSSGDSDGNAVYQVISKYFGGEIMKKIILTAVAICTMTVTTTWAEPDGNHNPQQPEEQSVTGTTPQTTEQTAPKGRSRGASIDDFVTPGRAVEKDCSAGDNCREPGKPQPEPRAPEKKCASPNCD
jgi:hypothetical protein